MDNKIDLTENISCYVCAWRENCKKRFSQSPDYAKRCADFSWDMEIKKRIIKEQIEKENGAGTE